MQAVHRLRNLVSVALLLLLVLLLVAPLQAATSQASPAEIATSSDYPVATVATAALNVRAGPSTNYHVLTAVRYGQQLSLLGRNADATWVMVRLPGGLEGWVSAWYLNSPVAIASLPVAGSSPSSSMTATVTLGAAHVRSGPSKSYPSVAIGYQGQPLTLLGRNTYTTWVKVRVPAGTEGWITASLLTSSYPLNNLPVVGVEPPPAPPPPPAQATGVVATTALNVRSGPGTEYSVLTAIPWSTTVSLLGRAAGSSWVQVRMPGGLVGWVNGLYLNTTVAISTLPMVGSTTPTAATGTVNIGALNVRYGPGVGYYPFTVIFQGNSVTLLGRNANSSWAQIRLADGRVGWVNASFLNTAVPVSSLPVTG